jgi:cytochrome bd-type quinol oxidase subunit 1
MQVLAYRRRDEVWERLTRFFGTLFLINFAMGVVTGIVQEFRSWPVSLRSAASRSIRSSGLAA